MPDARKYNEPISDLSKWITATPTDTALSLPFYLTEAGHFYADPDYCIDRAAHDSFLFLYTRSGCGQINSNGVQFLLPKRHAALIDCHFPHSYDSGKNEWEFLWLHIGGAAIEGFFQILFPGDPSAIPIVDTALLINQTNEIMEYAKKNDIVHSVELSVLLHGLLNFLLKNSIQQEHIKNNGRYAALIDCAIAQIENNYGGQLSIDDLLADIPLSKYHFIRLFKRMTGTTPYQYLINQRIHAAKFLLGTSDQSVGEIALKCGFSDTSNFIAQFKKHTGQKPLSYRQYFNS